MTTSTEVPKPLNEALQHILAGVQAWRDENTPEKLQAMVRRQLEQHRETIVLKLLGFDTKYDGRWDLDHCNGRAGESAAGTYLRNVQAKVIKDWLEDVQLPLIPKTAIEGMQAAARTEYERCLRESLWRQAKTQADLDAKNLIAEIANADQLDNIQKLLKLIEAEPSAAPHPTEFD